MITYFRWIHKNSWSTLFSRYFYIIYCCSSSVLKCKINKINNTFQHINNIMPKMINKSRLACLKLGYLFAYENCYKYCFGYLNWFVDFSKQTSLNLSYIYISMSFGIKKDMDSITICVVAVILTVILSLFSRFWKFIKFYQLVSKIPGPKGVPI